MIHILMWRTKSKSDSDLAYASRDRNLNVFSCGDAHVG